jgi:myosin-crossreactive antigen
MAALIAKIQTMGAGAYKGFLAARVRRTSQTSGPRRKQMKAHIVGGGFGGLAAAAYLIRNADAPGQDITIYEADERLGDGLMNASAPSF